MFGSDALTALVNRSCVDLSTLKVAHVGAARRVDDELGEHFAFDVRRAEHVRVARRRVARDTATPAFRPGTRSTSGCRSTGVRRAADDALGDTAGDALTREVFLVRDLLGKVDVGEDIRDLDRSGQHLEAFRRRCLHDHFRRGWLGLFLGRRRLVLLDRDELDLLCLRLVQLLARVQRADTPPPVMSIA